MLVTANNNNNNNKLAEEIARYGESSSKRINIPFPLGFFARFARLENGGSVSLVEKHWLIRSIGNTDKI